MMRSLAAALLVTVGALGAARHAADADQNERDGGPWLILLCKLPHTNDVPGTRADFEAELLEPLLDYYAEVSYGRMPMTGTRVSGWHELPAADMPGEIMQECLEQADLDLSPFYGIAFQINGTITPFGGRTTGLDPSDPERTFGVAMLAGTEAEFAGLGLYAHEMGHALGFRHYRTIEGSDNRWTKWDPEGLPRAVHYNGANKRSVGWIRTDEEVRLEGVGHWSGTLAPLSLPPADDPVLVVMDLGDGRILTVEARERVGWDGRDFGVPGEGVVLHTLVELNGDGFFHRAEVIDADGNGDVHDDGAIWTPGEVFGDSMQGLFVSVNSSTERGYEISATRGWPLLVEIEGSGQVTGAGIACPPICARVAVEPGEEFTLTAEPGAGHLFGGWAGDCGGMDACSGTLTSRRVAVARFGMPLEITSTELPPATAGQAYDGRLEVAGGGSRPLWAAADPAALPTGLRLLGDGSFAGIPERSGTYRFEVVVEWESLHASDSIVLRVRRPAMTVDEWTRALLDPSSDAADEWALDAHGNRNGQLDVGDFRAWLLAEDN